MKHIKSALIAASFAVVAFLIVSPLVLDETATPASNRVVTGEYHQTKGMPGTTMSATVTDGKIKVVLLLDSGEEGDSDASGTYWVGSFDTSNTSDSFTVISKADTKTLDASLLGSRDDTKTFTYKNGDLSFDFTMMGTTTTVHMTK